METIKVWRSAYELYTCSLAAPEVTGSPSYVVALGASPEEQDGSHIPAPKCKTLGYTSAEWCGHWHKSVPETVPKVGLKAIAAEWRDMIYKRLFGAEGGDDNVQ